MSPNNGAARRRWRRRDEEYDEELFGEGWLTTHLDAVMNELAAQPPEFWPRLTGSRAEAQPAIDAELHRRRALLV